MKLKLLLLALMLSVSCTIPDNPLKDIEPPADGIDGQDGADGQDGEDGVSIDFFDDENGDTVIITYLDAEPRNFEFDEGEEWFKRKTIRNGVDGVSYVTIQLKTSTETEECLTLTTFADTDGDGDLDEGETITFQNTICATNGADGSDGTNGTDGADGNSTFVDVFDTGDGTIIATGDDVNGDGTLFNEDGSFQEGEVFSSTFVRNGQDGQDGTDGQDGADGSDGANGTCFFIETSVLQPCPQCPTGGLVVIIGLDANGDCYFDAHELETLYICAPVSNDNPCNYCD